jgi:hypothetical protein
MTPHDWLVVVSLVAGAISVWQNMAISLAIANLRSELLQRIVAAERDMVALKESHRASSGLGGIVGSGMNQP